MLVFASDLEEVEEIGCGCVDGDEVLVCGWCRVGEGAHGEVLRALGVGLTKSNRGGGVNNNGGCDDRCESSAHLEVFFDLDCTHFEIVSVTMV